MALPASGQISFDNVRTEMSQSAKTSYATSGWTWGLTGGNLGSDGNYAPINVLSSGSRFSESSPLNLSNLSMSAWYNYDHNLYIELDVTGTLYQHANAANVCFPSTMLPIELGINDATFSINISGSSDAGEILHVVYGKPWLNNGGSAFGTYTTIFESSFFPITTSFDYNYTYNADSGSKIYCVLTNACP